MDSNDAYRGEGSTREENEYAITSFYYPNDTICWCKFLQSLTIFKAKFYEKEKETCYLGYRKNGGPYGAATVYE